MKKRPVNMDYVFEDELSSLESIQSRVDETADKNFDTIVVSSRISIETLKTLIAQAHSKNIRVMLVHEITNADMNYDINSLLGRLSFSSLSALFYAILSSNQNEALTVINEIYNQGNEPVQILSNLLEYYRNALILKAAAGVGNSVVQLNEEQIKTLSGCLDNIETHQLISLLDKCALYIKELKLTANPKLWLDVAILDMSNLVQNTKLEDLQRRLSLLETGETPKVMINSSPYNTPPSPVKKTDVMKQIRAEISKPEPAQVKETLKEEKVTPAASSEDDVLTSPVPMSKAPSSNGLKTQWAKFLENISSFPSRAILKQQALPVKLSAEEVVISIKNQSWLKQFGPEGAKYSFIVDAANSLFGNKVKKVIVRAPESGDDAIRKEQTSDSDEPPAPAPKTFEPASKAAEELKKEEIDEIVKEKRETEVKKPVPKAHKTEEQMFHSDEVNMIMDLFEGKIIE